STYCRAGISKERINKPAAAITIEGPTGVSANQLMVRPPATEQAPKTLAKAAIFSGVDEKRRAAAGGITSKEVISNTPTVRKAPAIRSASSTMSKVRASVTGTPSTRANSSFTVMLSKWRQFKASTTNINAAPAHKKAASRMLTASKSPNKKPKRSTFTPGSKLSATIPSASVVWATIPSSVSLAIKRCCCKAVSTKASTTQQTITAGYKDIPTAKPKAAPNKEPWAKVSPKKAMRRH